MILCVLITSQQAGKQEEFEEAFADHDRDASGPQLTDI
jgi:hypothetical protein